MSKLYRKYISLKINDNNSCYLFKSGIFYIFISEDARRLAPLLNLKLTNLTSCIVKCGFPINSLEKYSKKLDELNINVKIVDLNDMTLSTNLGDYLSSQQILEIIDDFLKVDVDNLSISQAFDLLNSLQDKFKKFHINEF